MTVFQSARVTGLTHASSVMPEVRCSEALSATFTRAPPENDSALPNFPLVDHSALLSEPVLPFPDWSAVVAPEPSSRPYAATRPVGTTTETVALAWFDAGLTLPAASSAGTL